MVLDEASPTAQDSFSTSDNVQDDTDPYSTSSRRPSSATLPSSIDLSRLSRPIPIVGPLLGFRDENLRRIIELDAASMTAVLQRPLTTPEWEAAAFHMAKLQSYASYGWPTGFIWGGLRARRTMHEWRFPLYKPNLEKIGRERFNEFLGLKGEMARGAWHTLRFGIYMGLYGGMMKMLLTFYGVNVAIAGQKVDQRLKDFWDTLKTVDKEELQRRKRTSFDPMYSASGARGTASDDSTGEGSEAAQPQRPPLPNDQSVWGRRRAAAARGELPGPVNTQDQPRESVQSNSSAFDFDDMSPLAREEPDSRQTGGQQETAWDRLRRGNGSQPAASQNAQNRPLQGAQGDAWAKLRGGGGDTSGDVHDFSDSGDGSA